MSHYAIFAQPNRAVSLDIASIFSKSEKIFWSKYDRSVNLQKYQHKTFLFPGTLHVDQQHISEIKLVFKQIPQVHTIFKVCVSTLQNTIAVFAYVKKSLVITKENMPPCLDIFLDRFFNRSMSNVNASYLENYNLESTSPVLQYRNLNTQPVRNLAL